MNDKTKDGLKLGSMISLLVGVISLIVVIPTIARIMNKTKPEEIDTRLYFDREDEDYFISIGGVYNPSGPTPSPTFSNNAPSYTFSGNAVFDYEFKLPYYVSGAQNLETLFIDRMTRETGPDWNMRFYYEGVEVGGSGDYFFTMQIYGLSNY